MAENIKENEAFIKAFKSLQKELENVVKPIKETIKQVDEIFKPLRDVINEIVDRINNSTLTDEDKERIKAIAQQLVDNDIVVTPEEGPFYFYNFNCTKKNIKSLYDSYSSGRKFTNLVNPLLSSEEINREYIHEAVKCYKNKCYLACSSLLLSIIDSHFIFKNKLDSKGRRRTLSNPLAKECLDEVESKNTFEYFFLIQSNVLLILAKYYNYGDDFKAEPANINRNFINHGMCKRKPTKQDCIKLFILCSYLEMI